MKQWRRLLAALLAALLTCALPLVALLTLLGVVAGLAPAYRAMAIKPVDAMRDE